MLHDQGVYTGVKIGSSFFFEPQSHMNRAEFLMLLITAAGYADTMTPTVNTGLPNDSEIPPHLKRYIKMGIDEGMLSPQSPFNWQEIPIRAEAVVLAAKAAKISDVKEYSLTMPDRDELPAWARDSYRDLAAYRMLDLHDGYAHPSSALDNAYAADLAWQVYKTASRR
jgi:hypothetical protein